MSIVFWSNRITKKILWNLQRNKKIPPSPPIPRMITIAESCPVLHLTIEPENYQLLRLFLTLVFFIEKKVKLYEMELKYRENGGWEKSSVLFFQMFIFSRQPLFELGECFFIIFRRGSLLRFRIRTGKDLVI